MRRFDAGLYQQYAFPADTVNLSDFAEADLFVDQSGPRKYPLVIEMQAIVDHPKPHAHATFATFDRNGTGVQNLSCKPIIQRLSVGGLTFILKEIYGIENKEESGGGGDDEDNTECVVCMSDTRDTMALPCRHLCLCNPCAEVLRYQNNKCPICRTVFHSLLQIRVLRDKENISEEDRDPNESEDEETAELVPPGFGLVSLVSALTNPKTDEVASAADARGSEGSERTVVGTRSSSDRAPTQDEGGPAEGGGDGGKEAAEATAVPETAAAFVAAYADSAVQDKGKGKALASQAASQSASDIIQDRGDRAQGDVKMHDFPSNERLEVEDTSTVVANSRTGESVSEFKLPGTPDTEGKTLRKQGGSSGDTAAGEPGGDEELSL